MGHWSILNVMVYFLARSTKTPYVICPAGELNIFGRSRWIKKSFNFLIGQKIVEEASGYIAVAKNELIDIQKYNVCPKNVKKIHNGVNPIDFKRLNTCSFSDEHSLHLSPFILFMGRLNYIKGPDILLDAFIQIADDYPDLHLVFAGPNEGMLSSLMVTVERTGLLNRVHFLGYLAGDEKNAAYRAAKLLVVPSRQEAMSIVAIEAGICGLPVLMTDQCGFGEVREVDARLEVPANREGIVSGLTSLLDGSAPLPALAEKWTTFIERNFTWSTIGPKYCDLYRAMLGHT
jgi:glycosyltransferase involved in cell wall biosynthesis